MDTLSRKNVAAALAAALIAAGCAGARAKKAATASPVQNAQGQDNSAIQNASNDQEPSSRSMLEQAIPELASVRFTYDSSWLSASARKTLQDNAAWLADHPGVRVQVAGNCDQRGTIEYNLALGERRARSVREYYTHLGISGDRVSTISYGKEKPLCDAMVESCWKKNRRADTLETVSQAVSRIP